MIYEIDKASFSSINSLLDDSMDNIEVLFFSMEAKVRKSGA